MLRTSLVLISLTAFAGISAWAYLPWWELAFRSDASPLSWLSGVLLFACAALSLQLGANGSLSPKMSLWLVLAMTTMALDEQFMYHEYWKYHCTEWTSWCGRASKGHVDWIGDAPMIMVGLLGMLTVTLLWKSLPSRIVRGHFLAAILVGVVLALGTHFTHLSGMLPADVAYFEEVFEVFSEALFMCALIEIRPGARQQAHPVDA